MRVSCGLVPNHFTLPMIVSSYAEVKDYVSGVSIHGLVFKVGVLLSNCAAVGSSFIYMYSRCGEVGSARKVFDEMCVRDVVAWTALVIGYVQNGEPENGLRCVSEMFRIGEMDVRPNFRTLEGGFQACGDLEAVCAAVQSSIVSMYSRCGTLEESSMSFMEVPVKDIKLWTSIICVYGNEDVLKNVWLDLWKCLNVFNNVCILDKEIWNSMVHGYSKVGCGVKCIELLTEMLNVGIHPDSYSLVSVISSCSQMGEINLGRSLHGYALKCMMKEEHVSVSNSLIDMYANIGDLKSARKLFCRTDKDIITWNTTEKQSIQFMSLDNSKFRLKPLQQRNMPTTKPHLTAIVL
ncbi:Pentatricopeptide repeat-containing protein [Artemisia annua]|uniref:Pentatricopeptide repeat-containing protein n=1 Tax=Artemisia annua TaxID=35608 RepID=A0A2U1NFK3_ARTAN|nr:Pentatricopeptide repeat-containing protein [Artemisia annua]